MKKAYAKINLILDVQGKRENGYHGVSMIMQAVELYDKVFLTYEKKDMGTKEINLTNSVPFLPSDERNIAYKAAVLMMDTFRPDEGYAITIHIEKHIPVAAGLAGGSSNAAAVINGLSQVLGLEPYEGLSIDHSHVVRLC